LFSSFLLLLLWMYICTKRLRCRSIHANSVLWSHSPLLLLSYCFFPSFFFSFFFNTTWQCLMYLSLNAKNLIWFLLIGLGFDTHSFTSPLPLAPHLQSILLWLFWRWGSHKVFSCAGLKLWSPPPISASQEAWITGMSHWHPYNIWCFFLCSPGWPLILLLPQSPKYRDYGHVSLHSANLFNSNQPTFCESQCVF
jgi:hypothetical protein